MSNLLEEVRNIEEGFASDAQRRAAFASGYKEKGKKKKEEVELDEDIRKKYKGKEQKVVDMMIMRNGVDSVQKSHDKDPKKFDAMVKRMSKSIKEETELDEITQKFAVIDPDGNVLAFASDEKDANSLARNNLRRVKGKVVKLKRGMSMNRGQKMIGRPLETGMAEEVDIQEDGHTDVASAVRQCKTVVEDATQMMSKLQGMSPEDSLPTWWTNKLAVASNSMNKMRDYLLVPSVSESVELDEKAKIEFNDDDKNTISITKKGKLQGKMTKRSDGTWGVVRGGKHYPIKGGKNLDVAKAAVRDLFGEDFELEEVNISDYVVNTLRDIKRSKSARNLKLKGGSVKVDMNTANMMLQVLDKINPMNKKKIMDILDKGTKNDFMKVHGAVMKAIR